MKHTKIAVFWKTLFLWVILYSLTLTTVGAKKRTSGKKTSPSGLETDVDDPRDKVVRDRRELLATHPLCEIGQRCRRKREVNIPDVKVSDRIGSKLLQRLARISAVFDREKRSVIRRKNQKIDRRTLAKADKIYLSRPRGTSDKNSVGHRVYIANGKSRGGKRGKVGLVGGYYPVPKRGNAHLRRRTYFKQKRRIHKFMRSLKHRMSKRLFHIILIRHNMKAWLAKRMIYNMLQNARKNPDQWFRQSVIKILLQLFKYQHHKAAKLIKLFDKSLSERKLQGKSDKHEGKGKNENESKTKDLETTLSRFNSLITKMEKNDNDMRYLIKKEMIRGVRMFRLHSPRIRVKLRTILKLISEKKYADARVKIVELLQSKATNPEN